MIAIGIPSASAQPLRAIPALNARVLDETGTLNEAQRQSLEARLTAMEQQHGSQVVVLMVPSTAPEDIAAYANRVGNAWKIGRKNVGDGVLVLVAKDDRRMRIEVAKALEGAIPDIAAARIIDDTMKPRFRTGDFAGGLDAAVQQIGARIAGDRQRRIVVFHAETGLLQRQCDVETLAGRRGRELGVHQRAVRRLLGHREGLGREPQREGGRQRRVRPEGAVDQDEHSRPVELRPNRNLERFEFDGALGARRRQRPQETADQGDQDDKTSLEGHKAQIDFV